MVEVKIIYNHVKKGTSFRMAFQTTEMDDAIELLQKFNEVLYDEGYHTSDVVLNEEAPV